MTDEELQDLRDWFGAHHTEWCGEEMNANVIVALAELAKKRREVCKNCRMYRSKGRAPHCAIATWAIGELDDDCFTDDIQPDDTCGRWEPKT